MAIRIVAHAEPLHDCDRALVGFNYKINNLGQAVLWESEMDEGGCRFGAVAIAQKRVARRQPISAVSAGWLGALLPFHGTEPKAGLVDCRADAPPSLLTG